jgi:hypothetical protein
MHLSQWRLQTRCQNINFDVALQVATATSQTRCQNKNLSSSNALALKGDGRWNSHWFAARHAQNTPTGFRPTHFRFASGARVIYPTVEIGLKMFNLEINWARLHFEWWSGMGWWFTYWLQLDDLTKLNNYTNIVSLKRMGVVVVVMVFGLVLMLDGNWGGGEAV